MIKRILDISEQAYIHLHQQQLQIEKQGKLVASIPVEDLGVLILQHPAIVVTQTALVACQQNNTVVVFCNAQHLPYSVLLPLTEGHSLHTRILRQQMEITQPTRKRLWQQIVRAKIAQQATVLEQTGESSPHLHRMLNKVKPGDPENHEAQAAQHYWRKLMGDDFRRDRTAGGINALLNYGYAIMRAVLARSLVGTGLHPALGLHHRNQYNGLCLADDLMEPFRPWVDYEVHQYAANADPPEVCRDSKQRLLALLSAPVSLADKQLPLMVASHQLAAGLKSAIAGDSRDLLFPQKIWDN
ncbi:MAG: type II CRISPR-associated endonuclease Cas1 [Cellvibrionales bacterium]|nr:type II CRISPR-associated endonuclease Cas1 [Cellvibrionales bacterium]